MRIAQVAPLYESVPPHAYGGTERVVSYLTEELVRRGHDVTLFATGDSRTTATLVPGCSRALRLDRRCVDSLPHHISMLDTVFQRAGEFDILHFHCDYLHFPLSRRAGVPTITTLHGRLDIPDLAPLFRHFPEMPVVSISDAQRRPLSWAQWVGTVYHGLPPDSYRLSHPAGRYLAFLGRFSPEKGVERAIEIAARSCLPIKLAAKIDPADRDYFERSIRPLLSRPGVEYVGEIGEREKQAFLGEALALLFPIDWPEPFGLVMIEAMACGTPVIAFRSGSVPEIIEDGVTGFVVNSIPDAERAVERIGELSRQRCRQEFNDRFTVARMADRYLRIYGRIIAMRPGAEPGVSAEDLESPEESGAPEPVV